MPPRPAPHFVTGLDTLESELLAEKAAALGRSAEAAKCALTKLKTCHERDEARARLLKSAARAVHHYFIQRELCGLRRHDDAIRNLAIPREVLVRLGAS
ncbi:MAG: hypothetical protein LJE67_03680 [Salaquimonas sp.]|nr:hypothetical protein [Salaquimonas sp.]